MLSNVVGQKPNIEIATLLLDYGASIVLKVKGGYDNALQTACKFENTDIVKLLLEHGGIDYLPKNKGRLPEWATRNEEIKNLILSYYK
jgi:ankyrin repeat protein